MRISDWSSDVCSSDLPHEAGFVGRGQHEVASRRRLEDLAVEGEGAVHGERDAVAGTAQIPGRERTILAAEEHAPRIAQQPLGRIGDGGEAKGPAGAAPERPAAERSEEHKSELQSLMRISYAGIC